MRCCARVLSILLFTLAGSARADEILSRLLPPDVGTYGHLIDKLFFVLIYLTGTAFLIVVGTIIYFCIRYRATPERRAEYTHGNSWRALAVTSTLSLLVFISIDMNTVRLSNAAAKEMQNPPANAMVVKVLAQQFSWSFHLAGKDGKFGKTDMTLVDNDNLCGVVPSDPQGRDDIVVEGLLCVPVNQPVVLIMESKDVLHSLFLPHFRVKQDVVPGMQTQMWFQCTKTGEYEIACAELCGMLHSQMGGRLRVYEQQAYEDWLLKQQGVGE
jgi:cytochrome c oxidase subunit II